MKGSVVRPDGRYKTWRIRWETRPDPVTGKRRQFLKAGFGTRREAEQALRRILSEVDEGTFVPPSKQRVAEYLRLWLEGLDLSVNTLADYRMQVEKRIIPVIGRHLVSQVTPEILDAFYRQLGREGGRQGQGLSRRSVRLVHAILRKAFADGVKRGTLGRNPAARATPPKHVRQEFRTWRAEELRSFLEAAQGDRLYPALFMAATTGMRRSEVLGLRWVDVDLNAARVSIQQRVVLVDAQPVVLFGTKRESSRRLISLDPATVSALASWKLRQIEERLTAGQAWQETGLVFTTDKGQAINPERLSRRFRDLSEAADLPRIRFHDLRHTYATLALQAGVPVKVVSERLGHKTTTITENLYLHVTPQMAEEAATKVADLILGTQVRSRCEQSVNTSDAGQVSSATRSRTERRRSAQTDKLDAERA